MPLALFAVVALQVLAMPLQNAVVRHMEAEADWVALQTTCDPGADRGAMHLLAVKSLSDPQPPGVWYELMEDHPSIIRRIAMANAWPLGRPLQATRRGGGARPPTPLACRRAGQTTLGRVRWKQQRRRPRPA